MRAVTNAGPLVHLSWIDQLDVLRFVFDEVVAPMAVRDEVLQPGPDVPGVAAIRDAFAAGWVAVRPVADRAAVTRLLTELDRGEAEAIVLMREAAADVLLLDERRARAHAQHEGLPITGTIGVLRLARDRGLVPAVAPLLDELRRRGFRIGTDLGVQIVREEAGRRPGRRLHPPPRSVTPSLRDGRSATPATRRTHRGPRATTPH